MTIKEIAKLAGVSSAAVSRYLNGGYVKLRDAGKFAQAKQAAVEQNQPKDEPEKPSEGTENAADSENGRSESTPQKPRERKRKR